MQSSVTALNPQPPTLQTAKSKVGRCSLSQQLVRFANEHRLPQALNQKLSWFLKQKHTPILDLRPAILLQLSIFSLSANTALNNE